VARPTVTVGIKPTGVRRTLAHSPTVGAARPSADDLDRAMAFILESVADGHVGVDQARRLIRAKGVIPAAKQIRKATRDVRRQESIAHPQHEPHVRTRAAAAKKKQQKKEKRKRK